MLLGLVFAVRPDSRTPEEMRDDLSVQLTQMPARLESARDENALESVRSEVARMYSSMLKTVDHMPDAASARLPDGRTLDQATAEFAERMRGVAAWLPDAPDGPELCHDLASLADGYRESLAPRIEQSREHYRKQYKPLYTLGEIFHQYLETYKGPPPNWDAIEAFAQNSPEQASAARDVRSWGAVAFWGIPMKKISGRGCDFVLVYTTDVLDEGCLILTLNQGVFRIRSDDLQRRLLAQADDVRAAIGVDVLAPFAEKNRKEPPSTPPPSFTSWIPYGWSAPPPPEPPANRDKRFAAMNDSGKGPGRVSVSVEGILYESDCDPILDHIFRAVGSTGVIGTSSRSDFDTWEFVVSGVQDIRQFAYRLDLGPITVFQEPEAKIHIQLDWARLPRRESIPQNPFFPAPPGAPPTRPDDEQMPTNPFAQDSAGIPVKQREV